MSTSERFWASVEKIPFHTCWEWAGKNQVDGYGRLRETETAHDELAPRVSWKLHYGPIPQGLWVLHRCDNPGCVRPDHLFLGTVKDNYLDALKKGRMDYLPGNVAKGQEMQRAKTHCPQGHPYSGANLITRVHRRAGRNPYLGRFCRACERVRVGRRAKGPKG